MHSRDTWWVFDWAFFLGQLATTDVLSRELLLLLVYAARTETTPGRQKQGGRAEEQKEREEEEEECLCIIGLDTKNQLDGVRIYESTRAYYTHTESK